jgi:hypothetical protein
MLEGNGFVGASWGWLQDRPAMRKRDFVTEILGLFHQRLGMRGIGAAGREDTAVGGGRGQADRFVD